MSLMNYQQYLNTQRTSLMSEITGVFFLITKRCTQRQTSTRIEHMKTIEKMRAIMLNVSTVLVVALVLPKQLMTTYDGCVEDVE